MRNSCVYILKCRGGLYYTGHTDNLEKRLSEHKQGLCRGFTSKRLPVKLVFYQMFNTRDAAFRAERQIKKWSKNKKEALIDGDWKNISILGKKNFKVEL